MKTATIKVERSPIYLLQTRILFHSSGGLSKASTSVLVPSQRSIGFKTIRFILI